jgi:uncharacterized membrane protein
MRKIISIIFTTLVTWQCLMSCSKESPNACEPVSFSLNIKPSDPCSGTGIVSVEVAGNSAYTFFVNNLPAQASPQFSALKVGNYKLRIQSATGCKKDTVFVVPVIASGPLFADVKSLLSRNCSGCHSGNNPQAGIDFTNDCAILSNWQRIKQRAVEGDPSPMPTSGLMPLAEREKIVRWINSGHRFED